MHTNLTRVPHLGKGSAAPQTDARLVMTGQQEEKVRVILFVAAVCFLAMSVITVGAFASCGRRRGASVTSRIRAYYDTSDASMLRTAFSLGGFTMCSSLLLVVNKVAVHHLPAPAFVLLLQFLASWLPVKLCGLGGCLLVDELSWEKLLGFLPISLVVLASVYTNIKTLQYANVETLIVFRASTPLAISLCDFIFLGRQLPSRRSALSLLIMLFGSAGYTYTDSSYVVRGYVWLALWYFLFIFNQIYLKKKVDTVEVLSMWGHVFYTNLWCFMLSGPMIAATEPTLLRGSLMFTPAAIGAVAASCVLGVGMSYFSFAARALVSATSFAILGNVCKVLTVFINICVWDKHASSVGVAFLLLCLGATGAYEQAPLREEAVMPTMSAENELLAAPAGATAGTEAGRSK